MTSDQRPQVAIALETRSAVAAWRRSQPRCAKFCSICGADSWHLRGTDVDTCKRGHHVPCERGACR